MSEFNPYQAPNSDVAAVDDGALVLASRGQRLAAAMVDGLISLALVVPVMFVMGIFDYTQRGEEPPFMLTLGGSVFGFLVFIALHFVLLKKYGQTIGKWLLKIRIADMEGGKPEVQTILLKRYLPLSIVGLIPVAGQFLPLADVLLIFRKDRRCAHDLIAGTQVLQVRGK
jgi:uncharacterized RDD family membrane protein YckC